MEETSTPPISQQSLSKSNVEETSTPPISQLSLGKILSESNQIIKSQPGNFLFLAVLFLFPSVAVIIYLVYNFISNYLLNIINSSTNSFGPDQDDIIPNIIQTSKTLLLPLAYAFFISLFSLCAVGSITYTAFHTFHGKPIKLKSAITSITKSFFPLLGTTLLVQTIVSAIIIILFSVISIAWSLGFKITVFFPNILAFCTVMAILFLLLVTHLHLKWALAPVVVVVESSWGFESLKRSASLMKGRRQLLLSMSCVIGLPQAMMVLVTCHSWIDMGLNGVTLADEWNHILYILAPQILMMSISLTLSQLIGMVVNVVLYVYCKAILDGEEFPRPGEYVRLPVQDKKVGTTTEVSAVPYIVMCGIFSLVIIFQLFSGYKYI